MVEQHLEQDDDEERDKDKLAEEVGKLLNFKRPQSSGGGG